MREMEIVKLITILDGKAATNQTLRKDRIHRKIGS
jgi:hypothetical protein